MEIQRKFLQEIKKYLNISFEKFYGNSNAYKTEDKLNYCLYIQTDDKSNSSASPKVIEKLKEENKPWFLVLLKSKISGNVLLEGDVDYYTNKVWKKNNVGEFITNKSDTSRHKPFNSINEFSILIKENLPLKADDTGYIENILKSKKDIIHRVNKQFIQEEKHSVEEVASIITEIENTNPELIVTEGKVRLVTHIARERNSKIIKQKKQYAIEINKFYCEVCTFSFIDKYNAEFIECHHRSPIAITGVRKTKSEDLALVCSNCHRMLHRKFDGKYLSVEELRKRINR